MQHNQRQQAASQSSASSTHTPARRSRPARRSVSFVPSDNGLININTASIQLLMTLPGIGEIMAENIIACRPFHHNADLRNVYGIGARKYAMLERLVCV